MQLTFVSFTYMKYNTNLFDETAESNEHAREIYVCGGISIIYTQPAYDDVIAREYQFPLANVILTIKTGVVCVHTRRTLHFKCTHYNELKSATNPHTCYITSESHNRLS